MLGLALLSALESPMPKRKRGPAVDLLSMSTDGPENAGDQQPAESGGECGMYLVCCNQVIFNEIEQGLSRSQIAVTYAMAIRSEAAGADKPDWSEINHAIVRQWGRRSCERIKKMAWDIVEGRKSAREILETGP